MILFVYEMQTAAMKGVCVEAKVEGTHQLQGETSH